MGLFRKKRVGKNEAQGEKPLVEALGYTISLDTVISKEDCMIVRCKVQFPIADSTKFEIVVRNKAGENISTKCVFMGKGQPQTKIADDLVYQELMYSVFVSYPEQDLIVAVIDTKSKQVIHEQLIAGEQIRSLRAHQDDILYKFASDDPYYNEWLTHHRASEYELQLQRKKELDITPKFSIVVPLFQTNITYFDELIGSIRKQTYSNWELILVNASPEITELKTKLVSLQDEDSRMRVIELTGNEGITLNTACGIDSATGDFVCFVDHDDIIEPSCLFEYAQRINEKPDTDLLYCDEDKLFSNGHYGEVYFKPEFSLQFLRTCNYISHMLTIRTSLLKDLDYKDPAFDGSQDHHLVLQAAEKTEQIEHIPIVLYHWRATKHSTAESAEVKPYAADARLNAVQAHLERCNIKARVKQHPKIEYTCSVEYELSQPAPKVSIIVPTKDHVDLLKRCIDSIFEKSTYSNFEVIVVENNSDEEATFAYYEQLSTNNKVKVVEFKEAFNFSKLVNFGRQNATGDYLLLLNNDTEVITEDWLEKMLGLCIQSDVGIVGAKLLFPDETTQHAGVFAGCLPIHYFRNLPNGASSYHNFADSMRELSGVTAACMMVSAGTFDAVGGFDETLEVAYNDVDFCFRVRETGKTAVYQPAVELYHYESISRGYCQEVDTAARLIREKSRMWSDWSYAFTLPDPYATPNVRQGWEGSYFKF